MEAHFVTFFSPGTFVAEQTAKPISSWNVDAAVQMARTIVERYGSKPFAFRFSTKAREDTELDSKTVKTSRMYFLGGRVLTLPDVLREMPDEKILISNMRSNSYGKIVINDNSWRHVQPLAEGDVVLDIEKL